MTDLDGATTPGEPGTYASDAGEFAARWNRATPELRDRAVRRMMKDAEAVQLCEFNDHAGEIAQLRREVARLREAIEAAPHGYPCTTYTSYDESKPCRCWKIAALKTGDYL